MKKVFIGSFLSFLILTIILSSPIASAASFNVVDITGPEGQEMMPALLNPFSYTDQTGTFTTSFLDLELSSTEASFLNFNPTNNEWVEHLALQLAFNDGKSNGGNNIIGLLAIDSAGISPGDGIDFDSDFSAVFSGAGQFDFTVVANHRWKWTNPTQNTLSVTYFSDINTSIDFIDPFINGTNLEGSFGVIVQPVPAPSSLLLIAIATPLLFFRRRRVVGKSWSQPA